MDQPSDIPLPDDIGPILMVLTSHGELGDTGRSTGFYLGEVTHPLAVFEAAGIKVEFASIAGGEAPVDGLDLEDPINLRYWNDPLFRQAIRTTQRLDEVEVSRYAALFFAGGHGTMWDFPDSPAVQRAVRQTRESGAVIGAVCHGPSALVNVRLADGRYLVEGHEISAFTDAEERAVELEGVVPFLLASTLAARGAIHRAAPDFTPQVVVSGRLVTGQNPASAKGVAEAVVDKLRATG
jgi:putative intracellular protease/amidase